MTTTTGRLPKLLLTLLVRDEIDIIQANIDYHRLAGVDHFIVTDNGSTDGTKEYLVGLEEQGIITLIHEPQHNHNQGAWVTRMARLAAEKFDADWIIHADADEFFWVGGDNDLRSFFADVPAEVGTVRVKRHNALKDPGTNTGDYLQDNRFIWADGPSPKVCHRPSASAKIAEGNHRVQGIGGDVLETPDGIRVWHFPYRSYKQFEWKVVKGATALLANPDMPAGIGYHWRQWYEAYQQGKLQDVFKSKQPAAAPMQRAIAEGKGFMGGDFHRWCADNGIRGCRPAGILPG